MIYFLLAFLLFALPAHAQIFPPMTLTSPEIPGNNVDEDGDGTYDEAPTTSIVVDSDVAGQYHFHFRNCDKTIFQNTADDTFHDDFRVDKPTGSLIAEGQIVCYIPNLPAATYTLYVQYSTPSGTRAIWPAVNKSLAFTMNATNASILPFITTPQWIPLVYTGTAANFYAGLNGGDAVSFVWPGGAFALVFKADDMRLACGYLATTAAPTLRCPGEGDAQAPTGDYVMLEVGAETVPTAWNSAAFTHANVMQFTGSETGTVCGGALTIKALWDNAATDRQYFSINCADTDDETVHVGNDSASMPAGDEDRVDIRWRGDLTQVTDTDTYMVIGNLTPVYFDADWSGTANARNSAVNLNTTVVKNIVAATSWNMFIAVDLGFNAAPDTVGLFNLAVVDKDAGVANAIKYFHGTGLTSLAQWGTVVWSNTAVAASGGGGDVTAPVVTSPAIPAGTIEQTSFIMTAATDEAGTCRVRYGLTTGSHTWTSAGVAAVNGICTVAVTNSVSTPVVAGTEYFADMQVTDASNNAGDSSEVGPITTDGAVTTCTHYASATGTGDGLSVGKPYKIQNFTQSSHAAPGAVLCLADGTYTGIASMIQPTAGKNGTALAPIKIIATNDGAVFINGEVARKPVYLNNNDFWVIEGINAGNSGPLTVIAPVIHLATGSNNNIFRRVCAWNAAPNTNTSTWQINNSSFNLIEDGCAFGTGRKHYSNSQGGNDTTIRRSFGIWTSHNYVGPNMVYTNTYDSYRARYEDNIAMWNGPALAVINGNNQPYGCYAQDGFDNSTNHEAFSKYTTSMCLIRSTDTVPTSNTWAGIMGARTVNQTEFRDIVIYNESGHTGSQPILGQIYDNHTGSNQCATTPAGVCNRQMNNITSIGFARLQTINSGSWTTTNMRDYDTIAAMNTATASPFQTTAGTGARMCFRTIDGTLTSTKLWPWPMNQRIIDAMTLAGETPVDVMTTITDRFGAIPAGCTT
jgi:hypothetical protein